MLKKKYRLKTVSLTKAKSFSTPYFNLKVAKNNSQVSHFAFVVSKRVDKRATVRNKLKRKMRSIIEDLFDRIEKGHDFVFYPKPKAIGEGRNNIFKDIQNLLIKEKLLQ